MTIIQFCRLAGVITISLGALTASGQMSAVPPAANLAPIAFLTSHEWEAQLPNTPDGKKVKIHAQFSWTQNRQAIRISNQFITDGKPSPYIDGLYAWDPQQRAIVFWYVGAEGSLTKGVLRQEAGKLVHEFAETKPDGKTAQYVCQVTPDNGETGWQNEIFAGSRKELTPIAKVQYEVAQ